MMYSEYKLNKQSDKYTALSYTFPNLEPVCCSVPGSDCYSSWPTYKFLRRQVRSSGIPISRKAPLQYSCLENPHGWRSLEGCSPQGRWESDMTERLHFDFSLSCIGEGNSNPLQCSCLENPRDRGAWWAASMGSHSVGHDWSDLAAAGKLHSLLWSTQPKRSQWSRSKCFSGTPLHFLWSNECWQFSLLFLCLF